MSRPRCARRIRGRRALTPASQPRLIIPIIRGMLLFKPRQLWGEVNIVTSFLIGAGFNADAGRIRTPYDADCSYPLVSDVARLCFGLDSVSIPNGKSVENLFADAHENHDDAPMKRLTDKVMEADYYLGSTLAASEESNCYRRFFEAFPGSSFLTFNYDSLPEICLFRMKRWFPDDGYGVPVETDVEIEGLLPPNRRSQSIVLHLHGSFCLRSSEFELHGNPRGGTGWVDLLPSPKFKFDPDSLSGVFFPYRRVLPDEGYMTTDGRVIAPVPNKDPQLAQAFVQAIYQRACGVVRKSDVLISIGYSFNVHDCASYDPILLALEKSPSRRLVVVSPDAQGAASRLAVEYRHLSITAVNRTFRQWADGCFPF